MKILYLYAELMGYLIPVFKELSTYYNAQVHVVHWDHKKLTPYVPPTLANVNYYNKSELSFRQLEKLAEKINPDIVYISGWLDKEYLQVAKRLKRSGSIVVAGSDKQWTGSIKQKIASIAFPLTLKRYFNYMWVPGPFQFEFAARLGFQKSEIIFNHYCADTSLFETTFLKSREEKMKKYPHRFLFLGRFEEIKGIDLLLRAWSELEKGRMDWELCFIGNGKLRSELSKYPNIIVKDFMQPEKLISELSMAGCAILPSRKEPWALVLHEFAIAGLPIICSDICGASTTFTINGFNGFIFKNNNMNELKQKMKSIINKSDSELVKMSENSHNIGRRITPEITAASLMSVFNS